MKVLKRDGENEKQIVILLHGFGADCNDLYPLADVLDPDGNFTFCFPQAPHEVPIGPGWTGRGWFPISVRDLEAGIDFTEVRPPGLDQSAQLVYDLIFKLEPEKLILGGFSQGAMIATEVVLRNPNEVHGLILYSGSCLDRANWSKLAVGLKDKPFFQSHGTQDSTIPISAGQKLYDLLKAGGAKGGLLSFAGGHEIPNIVLAKSKEFLKVP